MPLLSARPPAVFVITTTLNSRERPPRANQHLVAARQDADAVPFAIAGAMTWAFVVALLKLRSIKS
jgi:hypothetical protein